MMGYCDHDWRVDPHILMATHPPLRHLVCARCGIGRVERPKALDCAYSNSPKDWPRVEAVA